MGPTGPRRFGRGPDTICTNRVGAKVAIQKIYHKNNVFQQQKKWPNGHFFLEPLIGIEPMTSSFITTFISPLGL